MSITQKVALVASIFLSSALAQQPGAYTPEVHPTLVSQTCTIAGGCVNVSTSIVLDSNYRWLHNVGGYDPCVPSGFDPKLCPNTTACAQNCALEGVDYSSYGINVSDNSITLNLFLTKNNVTTMSSPRVYLLANESNYDMYKLLNQEIAFDVDVSKTACGINGALYLSEMSETGSASDLNKAGAKYGTGYCDAQCPVQNFVNGVANLNSTYGACCNEMDLWEANSAATAFTPHPCNATSSYACSGLECGAGSNRYSGVCDEDGCDFNSYRNGNHGFYGPGLTVDTNKVFTVVTQFITDDGTATGTLTEIKRLYVQDGKVIQNSAVNITGLAADNSISDEYCVDQKKVFGGQNAFTAQGGLKKIGEAIGRGMVLIFSIWDDASGGMLWLDSTTGDASSPGNIRGPCGTDTGKGADVQAQYPNAAVTWSNVKRGDIGSTFHGAV